MRIVAVGDPHGELSKLKKIPLDGADLILVTGDLGKSDLGRKIFFDNMKREERGLSKIKYSPLEEKAAILENYDSSIAVIKYLIGIAPVLTIFGNAENTNAYTRKKSREIGMSLPFIYNNLNSTENVKIIDNRISRFNGLRIGGLNYFIDVGWAKIFVPNDRAMNQEAKKETEKAKHVLNWFGKVDILICHQPPYGILDKVSRKYAPEHWKGKHAGSRIILDYIKKYQPKYVFCGHTHEGEGHATIGRSQIYNLGVAGHKTINL